MHAQIGLHRYTVKFNGMYILVYKLFTTNLAIENELVDIK